MVSKRNIKLNIYCVHILFKYNENMSTIYNHFYVTFTDQKSFTEYILYSKRFNQTYYKMPKV